MSFLTDSALLGGLLKGPYFHMRRLLTERGYRQVAWLKMRHGLAPRYSARTIRAFGVSYRVPDVASFLSALDEIYGNGIYRFQTANPAPLIVDIGANVGVSVNYFLQSYPRARVIAYEADPEIFGCLESNVSAHGDRVTLHNAAVWDENTRLRFASEGADGGRVDVAGGVEVQAVDVRDVLSGADVELLKVDIEGAEDRVLPACRGMLGRVRRIFLEYHSSAGRPQQLAEIMTILDDAGFRLHIQSVATSPRPFMAVALHGAFDMQLNIFGWKEDR